MNRYKVTFLPDRKEIEVDEGVTLFLTYNMALFADHHLPLLCGVL